MLLIPCLTKKLHQPELYSGGKLPGLERELSRDEHFEEYIGKDVKVRLIRPMEGLGKEFCGVLKEAKGSELTIEDYSGENQVTINKKDTAWVKADDLDI